MTKPWAHVGFWSDDHTETLKRLWAEGKSASEISAAFNGAISRNAVIGKASRLGFVRSTLCQKTSSGLGWRNQGVRTQAKVFGETKVPKPAPKPTPKLAVAGNGAVFERADAEPKLPPISVRAWLPLPGSEPVTLMGLTSTTCRWPIDLAGAAEAHFCGRKAHGVYCDVHAALSRPRAPGAKEHLDRILSGVARRAAAA